MLLLALFACASTPADTSAAPLGDPVDLVPYVDPFIGTGGIGYSVGCGQPGATTPFGLVKASPDTADVNGASPGYYHGGGYHYDDVYIQGFSQMHMYAIGSTDYGDVGLMPVDRGAPTAALAPEQTMEAGYRARFSHDNESARPGWYQVRLDSPDVQVTVAATRHTALYQLDYGDLAAPTMLVDLGHMASDGNVQGGALQLDPKTGTITGHLISDGRMSPPFSVWVVAVPDTPPSSWGTWQGYQTETVGDASAIQVTNGATTASVDAVRQADGSYDHARFGAWLGYPAGTTTVKMRIAMSTVDQDGAWANYDAEAGTWDVDAVADDAWNLWEDALSHLRVWGGSEDDRTKLATALYHVLQMPTIFSDVDGRYIGFDQRVHTSDQPYHTDFSLWDTYRTTHPLYTLLWPDWHRELLASLANMTAQGGNLPRWPAGNGDAGSMVGTPADIVWAEAWRKGIRDWGEDAVLPVALDVAMGRLAPPYGGRPDVDQLDTYGYQPADNQNTSVSWTEEDAISDYALAEVADRMGGHGADVAVLRNRSHAWKRLYNPETGWIQGRNQDGSWKDLPSPSSWDDVYAEGNARQYLWLAPQEPEALFDVLGGRDVALTRLREMMDGTKAEESSRSPAVPNSWYWHGNEPSLHIPWMFGLAGAPDEGRVWVRWVMDTYYGVGNDGITGNDDAGASSAWYVFAAMGLYPLAGTERYVLGLPAFSRIEWDQGDGVFTITCNVDPLAGADPVDTTLNGLPWPAPFLSHDVLQPGGELHFGPGG